MPGERLEAENQRLREDNKIIDFLAESPTPATADPKPSMSNPFTRTELVDAVLDQTTAEPGTHLDATLPAGDSAKRDD
jgi:hypothetical protein